MLYLLVSWLLLCFHSCSNCCHHLPCSRWGLQNKVESFIHTTQKRIFGNFHREVRVSCSMLMLIQNTHAHAQYSMLMLQVFCWMDQWHGMTMEDIRALEEETKKRLDEERNKVYLRILILILHYLLIIMMLLFTFRATSKERRPWKSDSIFTLQNLPWSMTTDQWMKWKFTYVSSWLPLILLYDQNKPFMYWNCVIKSQVGIFPLT